MAINYGAYRKRAFKQGQKMGFMSSNRKRREAMAARMQQLAEDTGAAERAQAQSQYQANQKASLKENEEIQALTSAQAFVPRDDGKLEYSNSFFNNKATDAVKKSGVTYKTKAEYDAAVAATLVQVKGKHGQFRNRVYKDTNRANADLQKLQIASRLKQTTNSSKEQYTAFDTLMSLGMQRTQDPDGTPVAPLASGLVPESEKDKSLLPEAPLTSTDVSGAEDLNFGKITDPDRTIEVDGVKTNVMLSQNYGLVIPVGDGGYRRAPGFASPEVTPGSERPLPIGIFKDDVSKELKQKYANASKVVRLTKGIVALTKVPTAAIASTLPARVLEMFGTEWAELAGDEVSQKAFMTRKIQDVLRTEKEMTPETRGQITAAMGKLDSKKLFLSYALVKINRESGRFTGQELQLNLKRFESSDIPQVLAAVSDAHNEAMISIKKDVKQMVSERIVHDDYIRTLGHGVSKSEVLAGLNTDAKLMKDGSWMMRVREEDRERLGATFLTISTDGGIDYD